MKRPTLVVLDFRNRIARRYVPKTTGGFWREDGVIGKPGQPMMGFGGDEGLTLIEKFRTGALDGQEQPPIENQPEYA